MTFKSSGWRIVSSSVVGSGHVARGVGCEDFHTWKALPNGAWIAVVADGAGSARCSAEGAKTAATAALLFLSKLPGQSTVWNESFLHSAMSDCLQHARGALEGLIAGTEATRGCETIAQYATTLLAICVTQQLVAALQLGDGAIVFRKNSRELRLMFEPCHGEYINEAHFLTSSDFAERAQVRVVPSEQVDAIAVFTDGIEFLALDYANASAHEPFFEPMFSFASNPGTSDVVLEEFLKSDRVCERTDDDKTLLLAVRL